MSQSVLPAPATPLAEKIQKESHAELVAEKFPDRIGQKTRRALLWEKNGNSYFRVTRNVIEEWIKCESWWVVVDRNGSVTVSEEVSGKKTE